MIFKETEIIDLIKANQTVPKWIADARAYNVELEALVNGKEFTDLLIRIEHKEDENKHKARKKYARAVKDMFERLMRPADEIYTATGGSKPFIKEVKDDVLKKLRTVRDGKTMEKWLQNNWFNLLYKTDPNGILLYEWNKTECYPVYKNISTIRNYVSNGQKLRWILFEPKNISNGVREWRFIDDSKDYTITESQNTMVINLEKTFINPFGVVPGMINSDLTIIGSEKRLSVFENIIGIAKEYLRDLSHKSIYKFLLWDPIFWRYAVKCNTCHGTGKIGKNDCPDCYKGYYISKDITDMVTLPAPEDKEGMKIAPDIAGYIVPPPAIIEEFNKELKLLYDEQYKTLWGIAERTEVQKTATEVHYDMQPMITKLNVLADTCEFVEQWMTELFLKFNVNPSVTDVAIFYGRNYILESQEALLDRYEKSKAAGDATIVLDKQLEEWILSKYKNNPSALNDEQLRIKIEPFIHYTVEQVNNIWGQGEAKKKMLFTEWWIEADKNKNVEALKKEYQLYVDSKIIKPEQPAGETAEVEAEVIK